MKNNRFVFFLVFLTTASLALAQAPTAARDGKKLLTALDALKIRNVGSPDLSPDGKRVAYTVSELVTQEDKPWTSVTQVWVVPAAGGPARQYDPDLGD